MGLTNNGYRTTNFSEYLDKIVNDLNTEFPHMSNSSNNFAIVLSRIIAELLEENDSIRAEGYNNVYVSTAVGEHLSKAVKIGGISRRYGTKSYGKIKVTKKKDSAGIYIAPETLIESGKFKFTTLNKGYVSITTDDPVEIEIASVDVGSIQNMTDNSIFTPVVNINGLDKMICEAGTFGGTNTETDTELRSRYYNTVNSYKNSSLVGIISQISNVQDVIKCTGIENTSNIESEDGLPPHSFQLFCDGGSNSAIAKRIFEIKPAGIHTYGDISETINFNNVDYVVKFSRYKKRSIYYSFKIKPLISVFSSELEENIKKAIVEYTSKSNVISHSDVVGFLYNNVDGIASIREIKFGESPNPETDKTIIAKKGDIFITSNENISIVLEGGDSIDI